MSKWYNSSHSWRACSSEVGKSCEGLEVSHSLKLSCVSSWLITSSQMEVSCGSHEVSRWQFCIIIIIIIFIIMVIIIIIIILVTCSTIHWPVLVASVMSFSATLP